MQIFQLVIPSLYLLLSNAHTHSLKPRVLVSTQVLLPLFLIVDENTVCLAPLNENNFTILYNTRSRIPFSINQAKSAIIGIQSNKFRTESTSRSSLLLLLSDLR